jgi:ubiquinone/menaquinone biosynthesis C-methylase UbiE
MQAENEYLSILGCDLNASVLRNATGFTWSTSHESVQADGARLPIADGALTGVCLMNILHLVENPRLLLEETHRTMKRAGRMVVFVDLSKLPNKWEPQQFGLHLDALLREQFYITEIQDPSTMDPDLFPINHPPRGDVYLCLGEKN